jgi:hypothetical protein
MKYNPKPQILPKVKRLANPEYKEEYQMPADYQEQAKHLVELIERRDEYARMMPTLSPDQLRQMKPLYDKANRLVEDLEEQMAYEYERYQEERRREQELSELTWREEAMSEEHFIRVKHQRPYIFEEFAEEVTEGMTDAEREEHNRIIARREAEELEDILSGKINAPEYENLYIKHRLPDEWTAELLLQIVWVGWLNDSFFGINYEALERLDDERREYCFHNSDVLPVRRRNMEEAILDMKTTLGAGRRFLLDYAEEAIASGKFRLLRQGYTKHLDDYLMFLENCLYWKYVIIKHTMPAEKLEEYVRIVTEGFTPEEIEAFTKRAEEEYEEKKLYPLTHSLENERITTERVLQRRAAPGYRKIDGPQLSEREKMRILEDQKRRRDREADEPPGKIEHDLTAVFKRYLKALYAVTDGGGYAPARYEDEQSRKDEEMAKLFDDMERNMEKLYIIIKHQTPHLFEEFHRISTETFSPEMLEDFLERIAHLEATRLEEILKGKK